MLNWISIHLIALVPFEDANFDGVWNGDEHWLDLNEWSIQKEMM